MPLARLWRRDPVAAGNWGALLKDLASSDSLVRREAAQGLLTLARRAKAEGERPPEAAQAVSVLRELLAGERNGGVINRALQTLVALEARPELEGLLAHPGRAAILAAEGLGELGDPAAIPALLPLLEGDRSGLRLAATTSLEKLGLRLAQEDPTALEEVVPALARGLGDGDWRVARAASSALGSLGAAAVEPLLAALPALNADGQRYGLEALGELQDPRAAPAVLEALRNPNPYVKLAAVTAAGKLTLAEAYDPLQALVDRADPLLEFGSAEVQAALKAIKEANPSVSAPDPLPLAPAGPPQSNVTLQADAPQKLSSAAKLFARRPAPPGTDTSMPLIAPCGLGPPPEEPEEQPAAAQPQLPPFCPACGSDTNPATGGANLGMGQGGSGRWLCSACGTTLTEAALEPGGPSMSATPFAELPQEDPKPSSFEV